MRLVKDSAVAVVRSSRRCGATGAATLAESDADDASRAVLVERLGAEGAGEVTAAARQLHWELWRRDLLGTRSQVVSLVLEPASGLVVFGFNLYTLRLFHLADHARPLPLHKRPSRLQLELAARLPCVPRLGERDPRTCAEQHAYHRLLGCLPTAHLPATRLSSVRHMGLGRFVAENRCAHCLDHASVMGHCLTDSLPPDTPVPLNACRP